MIERLAYSALVLQMAVYISQKDLNGGLGLEHTDKGIIFFFWALIQNLTPVFLGGLADRKGRKNIMILSVIIASIGFITAAFQREFFPFLLSCAVIGFGLGLYKPALYGMMASEVNERNSSVAWGINVMLINLAVFFSPPLAKFLEGVSWEFFFIGLGVILLISLIPIAILKEPKYDNQQIHTPLLKDTFSSLFKPDIIYPVLILSGFMMIYMQFYETLPNFIFDWVDSSDLVIALSLPKFMTMETSAGTMIDFKWLYNINSGFILIAVVFVNWYISRLKITISLNIGILIAGAGLLISGWTSNGSYLIVGMLIYTLGEMITNPNYSKFMAEIAPKEKKSTYMGFINLSFAIGLAGGSILGAYLYKNYAEKSSLAMQYLREKFDYRQELNHSNALEILGELSGKSSNEVTEMLWNYYNPSKIWIIFALIAIISSGALYIYSKNKPNLSPKSHL